MERLGEKGENFLRAKILCYTVCSFVYMATVQVAVQGESAL